LHRTASRFAGVISLALALVVTANAAEPTNPNTTEIASTAATAAPSGGRAGFDFDKLLPMAWQRRPKVRFNVYTEMTPEGRKRRAPTPEQPVRYFANPARFAETGWLVERAGSHPAASEVEEAMRNAFQANGYTAVSSLDQKPDVMVFITYGSHATDPTYLATPEELAAGPDGADELVKFIFRDPQLYRDIIDRAQFVAGDQFARDLAKAINDFRHPPIGLPDLFTPLRVRGGDFDRMAYFTDVAFHSCYYAMASAYDFSAAQKGQKILLWRTKMTVVNYGLDVNEAIRPLIGAGGAYLGRETPEAVVVESHIDRKGRVIIGNPTVIEEASPHANRGTNDNH